MSMLERDLLTVADMAKFLRVSPKTVNKFVREGNLRCLQINSKVRRFRAEDVEDFVNNRTRALSKQVDKKRRRPVLFRKEGGDRKSVEDSGTDLLGKEIRGLCL
jgi:excisionase family DNA binding protein